MLANTSKRTLLRPRKLLRLVNKALQSSVGAGRLGSSPDEEQGSGLLTSALTAGVHIIPEHQMAGRPARVSHLPGNSGRGRRWGGQGRDRRAQNELVKVEGARSCSHFSDPRSDKSK